MKRSTEPKFASEAEMCAAFIAALPRNWTPYAETAGWDILLVRPDDGFQIGIQAKLRLNAEVITQACDGSVHHAEVGPDCRAVLVPRRDAGHFDTIAAYVGLTVIKITAEPRNPNRIFSPQLPDTPYGEGQWYELAASKRYKLPDYVPDVAAGAPAPLQLTRWKIQAIKIAVTLELRGFLTRRDFKHHHIDYRRWVAPGHGWLRVDGDRFVAGSRLPDFKAQHPRVYAEIAADHSRWMTPQ